MADRDGQEVGPIPGLPRRRDGGRATSCNYVNERLHHRSRPGPVSILQRLGRLKRGLGRGGKGVILHFVYLHFAFCSSN